MAQSIQPVGSAGELPDGTMIGEPNGNVGSRLRQLRLGRRLTLRALAEDVGITEGFLSQLENGRSAPSIRTLRKIAAALGVEPAEVFDGDDVPLPHHVTRGGGRMLTQGPFAEFRMTPAQSTSLDVLRGAIAVGAGSRLAYTHGDSDETLVVLEGTVEATVGDKDFVLTEGEMLSYRSSMPHSVRNNGDVVASVLWVTAPPTRVRHQ